MTLVTGVSGIERERNGLTPIAIRLLGLGFLLGLLLLLLPQVLAAPVAHAPIVIDGDDDFTTENGVVSGDGTAANPYVIDGFVIDITSGIAVQVSNTTSWLVLSNLTVRGEYRHRSYGICLDNCAHVRVNEVDISGTGMGMYGRDLPDIHIEGLVLSSDGRPSDSFDSGIVLDGNLNATLDGIRMEGRAYEGISMQARPSGEGTVILSNSSIWSRWISALIRAPAVTVSDCSFRCDDGMGLYVENWYGSGSLTIERNKVSGADSGIIGYTSFTLRAAMNTVQRCDVGLTFAFGKGIVESNTVSDCGTGLCIAGTPPYSGSVMSNRITNCTTAVTLMRCKQQCTPSQNRTLIEANRIEACGTGIAMSSINAFGQPAYYVIKENRITSCSQVGIDLYFVSDITVMDCQVSDVPVGILLDKILRCNISRSVIDAQECGILATRSSGVNITYNTIRGASGWAINATQDCSLYVHHNNFLLNNFDPATSNYNGPQVWDSTSGRYNDSSEGNYWSDYTIRYPYSRVFGRVWDVTYLLAGNAGNVDHHPLTLLVDWLPPLADAGANITVPQDTNVALNGTASSDDNGITRSEWSFIYGGKPVLLSGLLSNFTFHVPGVYTVLLIVWDAWGNHGSDMLTVTVLDTEPPFADAGPDLTVRMGEGFALDGSASRDNVGIVRFGWAVDPTGLNVSLEGVTVELSLEVPGIYVAVLTVVDEVGYLGTDEVLVRVLDTLPPTADAGPDIEVDQGATVSLDGSASTDNVGIDRWWWSFTYDGGDVTLDGTVVVFLFEVPGNYRVTLRVLDLDGNVGADDVIVLVHDTEPPVADAGPDLEVGQGPLGLSGLASRDNVGIVRYEWTVAHGTSSWTMEGPTVVFDLVEVGTCVLTLRVWDPEGNLGDDGSNIIVLDTTPPVADAGPDLIVDMGVPVALDGNASWDNVGVVHYAWTVMAEGKELRWEGVRVVHTFELPGIFQVGLTAQDAAGNTGQDIITVVVRDILPPVARAGEDLVVIEGARVTFDGSLSRDNVGIASMVWRFVYGDVEQSLTGPSPAFEFTLAGDYIVDLEVRDAADNVAHDDLTVQVLPLMVRWRLGPFREAGGSTVEEVRVDVRVNGTSYAGMTLKNGWLELVVSRYDLISPAEVSARKDGWEPLDFTTRLDEDGDPMDPVPPMVRTPDISVKGPMLLGLLAALLIVTVVLVAYAHWHRRNRART